MSSRQHLWPASERGDCLMQMRARWLWHAVQHVGHVTWGCSAALTLDSLPFYVLMWPLFIITLSAIEYTGVTQAERKRTMGDLSRPLFSRLKKGYSYMIEGWRMDMNLKRQVSCDSFFSTVFFGFYCFDLVENSSCKVIWHMIRSGYLKGAANNFPVYESLLISHNI